MDFNFGLGQASWRKNVNMAGKSALKSAKLPSLKVGQALFAVVSMNGSILPLKVNTQSARDKDVFSGRRFK